MKTKEQFAKAYLDIYDKARGELVLVPWYLFRKRERIKKRMRWADFHHRSLLKLIEKESKETKLTKLIRRSNVKDKVE